MAAPETQQEEEGPKMEEDRCDIVVMVIISAKSYTCLCPLVFDFSSQGREKGDQPQSQ